MTAPWDPVRAKRQKVARWTLLANRIGYLCLGVSFAVFVIGFAMGFTGLVVGITFGFLLAGCALLAPSIVIGYGVKAAERDDRARGR